MNWQSMRQPYLAETAHVILPLQAGVSGHFSGHKILKYPHQPRFSANSGEFGIFWAEAPQFRIIRIVLDALQGLKLYSCTILPRQTRLFNPMFWHINLWLEEELFALEQIRK